MSRLQDVILLGIRADQPAATVVSVGTLYYVTDEGVLERSNGTTWEEYSDTSGGGITQLTGAITAGPGSGSQAATIANDAITTLKILDKNVTYAKIQDISATARMLGRKTAGSGVVEEVTLSELLDFIGSAAQGDILFRGAATWTKLAAGTVGYVLQTNGVADPTWVPPSTVVVGGGGVSTNRTVLTNDQIKAINTTPIQIAAARAGQILRPIAITTIKETTAGAYATNPNFSARYDGLASPDINTPQSATITAADKRMLQYLMTQLNVSFVGSAAPINTRIMWRGSADTTLGHADNYMVVEIVYSSIADGP